ncbi:MAG: hypothetical protein V3R65_10895 [Acidiferrobacterales bacterium]
MSRNSDSSCVDSGNAIQLDRLDTFPVTGFSINCQAKYENYRCEKDATPSL